MNSLLRGQGAATPLCAHFLLRCCSNPSGSGAHLQAVQSHCPEVVPSSLQ